jgi:sodium-dependent dicarboxylate transporter 2/3/5
MSTESNSDFRNNSTPLPVEAFPSRPYFMLQKFGFVGGLILFALLMAALPSDMPMTAKKMAAVTALMGAWWATLAVPVPATAMLPLVLFPLVGILPTAKTAPLYADRVVVLYFALALLALTAQRWELHRRVTVWIVEGVGLGPRRMVLALMSATALAAMWFSGFVAALIMQSVAVRLIDQLKIATKDDPIDLENRPPQINFAIAVTLGIACAACIGSLGTVVGAPAVFLLVTQPTSPVDFAQWMIFGVPLAGVLLIVTWWWLAFVAFPIKLEKLSRARDALEKEHRSLGNMQRSEILVALTFAVVMLAWIFREPKSFGGLNLVGINSYVQQLDELSIALLAVVLLMMAPASMRSFRPVLSWRRARTLPWGSILLLGSGVAVAEGFRASGLTEYLAEFFPIRNADSFGALIGVVLAVLLVGELFPQTAIALVGFAYCSAQDGGFPLRIAVAAAAAITFLLPTTNYATVTGLSLRYIRRGELLRAMTVVKIFMAIVIILSVRFLVPRIFP